MSEAESKSGVTPPADKSVGRMPRRWLLFLVAVAGLNFVLGLLIGRGTPPLRFDILALERELAVLQEKQIQAEIKHFRVAMEESDTRQPLDFFHTLNQDDTPRPVPPREAKAPANSPQTPKPAPTGSGLGSAETKTNPGATRDKPSAGTIASSNKATNDIKGPLVQVAALREAAAADQIVRRLRAFGFSVRSVPAKTADRGIWYRVRVGPFADRQAAGEVRDRLNRLNYNAIVVDP